MIYNYILIGQGIAGSCLAWHLLDAGQKILVIDIPSKNDCSVVAGGIINPITGMRLTKTWMAEEILPYAHQFYLDLEHKSGLKFWHDREIIRPANDVEQLNDALSRMADGFLGNYIQYQETDPELDKIVNQSHGYYRIANGGNLDVNAFLEYTRSHLQAINAYAEAWIDHKEIEYLDNKIMVHGFETQDLIWCTGHHQNKTLPFDYLPFSPTRGEMLRIKSSALKPQFLYNKNAFIVHQKNDEYICGATFSHHTEEPISEEGKQQMIAKIEEVTPTPFEIINHYQGIRPTVVDRKPFIGKHYNLPKTYIFNGLGAKGVTQAPYFAKELLNFIQNNVQIAKEVNIERIHKKQQLL